MPKFYGRHLLLGVAIAALLNNSVFAADEAKPQALFDADGKVVKASDDSCVTTPAFPRTEKLKDCGDVSCKFEAPKGTDAKFLDKEGCALDSDNDGVPDYQDKCPHNTPEEISKGVYKDGDKIGCPIDSDGDGVPDYKDRCPNTPPNTQVDEFGCPPETIEYRTVLSAQEGMVNFDFNKANLRPKGVEAIDKLAKFITEDPGHLKEVVVEGHTDYKGSEAYNLTLSQKRAQSVVDYLVKKGVPKDKISAVGKGKGSPIAGTVTKQTTEQMAQNRRVEIIIRKTNSQK